MQMAINDRKKLKSRFGEAKYFLGPRFRTCYIKKNQSFDPRSRKLWLQSSDVVSLPPFPDSTCWFCVIIDSLLLWRSRIKKMREYIIIFYTSTIRKRDEKEENSFTK